jgi:hypothetical protein
MKRLICIGCGVGEDLEYASGDIRTVQLVDLTPTYCETGPPEKPIQEDLCGSCRSKLRTAFFGESEPELLNMPLMQTS